MTQLDPVEDWVDNVLLEWAAALELEQRGAIRAVLPLLVGNGDFFTDAAEGFGGVAGLPNHSSAETLDKVTMHLAQTTNDGGIGGLRDAVQQSTGQAEPTIRGIVSSLLKFQGVKISSSETPVAHGHGHMSGGTTDDLDECIERVQATVSSCLKRIGATLSSESSTAATEQDQAINMFGQLSQLGARSSSSSPSNDTEFPSSGVTLAGARFANGEEEPPAWRRAISSIRRTRSRTLPSSLFDELDVGAAARSDGGEGDDEEGIYSISESNVVINFGDEEQEESGLYLSN